MVKLSYKFDRLLPKRVLVIGDFMLDKYTHGEVNRISPEAPVSILKVLKEKSLPGGAGNVALNLAALGCQVSVLGRVGNDIFGMELGELLHKEGICIKGLITQNRFKTPLKNRLIANSQQMLRVDIEEVNPLQTALQKEIIQKLTKLLENIDIVAISDYKKGFLTNAILSEVITESNNKNIPVIVDPKGRDFSKYKYANIIKPNLKELFEAAKLDSYSIEDAAKVVLKQTQADILLITRSEKGITIFDKDFNRSDFPVLSKQVIDVTGAGDTVLAILALSIANDFRIDEAACLANVAASIAIKQLGCARITLCDLASRLLKADINNKVFEEDHLYAFKQVLKDKNFSLLSVKAEEGMSFTLFNTICEMSEKDHMVVIYIKDEESSDFIKMLSSLSEVDFIVLQKDNLQSLCAEIKPKNVCIIENNKSVQFTGNSIKSLLESVL